MKKKFTGRYMMLYALMIALVVALVLSLVSLMLHEKQQANLQREKMNNLLETINIESKPSQAEVKYKHYFTEEWTVRTDGSVASRYDIATDSFVSGEIRAFDINLKQEQESESRQTGTGFFPLYRYETEENSGWVVPLRGNGLWGAVYGMIALDTAFNEVVGITFDHDSETPGLGAEIATEGFRNRFIGKKILDEEGELIAITVKKNADRESLHEVDAITGSTMTSNGISAMIKNDLGRYRAFVERLQQEAKETTDSIQAR